jgi:membrane associated rhomboid family serine protease
MPPVGNPSAPSAPWFAEDLLPEASLGGQSGVWRGQSELMSLTDIAAQLRTQKAEEKAPIHWIEVPHAPRVVHISEVPELWEAQTERDLRHAQEAINTHRVVALLTGVACLTVLALDAPPAAMFVFAIFGIQSAETWFTSAEIRRLLRRDAPSYFHLCSRECRYVFWVDSHPASAMWRTWSLCVTWIVLFIIQLCVGLDASFQRAGLVKPPVWQGEVWRLFTGPMLHGNHWHIFMNAAAAISLAWLVERTAHRHVLMPLWLLGALGGSLFSLLLLPAHTGVGASGGLMAFVGFLAVMGWKRKNLLPPRFAMNVLRSIAFLALFGLMAWAVIDNAAHAGGLLTGALVSYWLFKNVDGGLPLPDSQRLTAIGWWGVIAFGALFAFTTWQLLMHR